MERRKLSRHHRPQGHRGALTVGIVLLVGLPLFLAGTLAGGPLGSGLAVLLVFFLVKLSRGKVYA